MVPRDYRHVAKRFIALTSPVYLLFYIILLVIRALDFDQFSNTQFIYSVLHVFGLQLIHWLIVSRKKTLSYRYLVNMLWFMVYNNILFFGFWVSVLGETRSFVYLLAPMSVVALFTITNMKQAVLYNIMLSTVLAVAAGVSVLEHGEALLTATIDWIYIFVYLVVSFWISYLAELYHQNKIKLASLVKNEQASREQLEYTLKKLEDAHKQLEQLSNTDALTNIPNRRYFDHAMERAWGAALISQHPLSIMMIDVDHFKKFNDEHGHQLGDECLQQVAKAIESCLSRQCDEVCRYGGEEFVVILPATNKQATYSVADRIRKRVSKINIRLGDQAIHVSVSVGISTLSAKNMIESIETLISQGDQALYHAKEQGRDCSYHYRDLDVK